MKPFALIMATLMAAAALLILCLNPGGWLPRTVVNVYACLTCSAGVILWPLYGFVPAKKSITTKNNIKP
jgi:hypothetical protein